jgi:hypothetical protein
VSDGTAAGTILIKDIYPGNGCCPYPYFLTRVLDKLFFIASDGTTGDELWMASKAPSGKVIYLPTIYKRKSL